jgi:hypothetical protein
VVLLYQSRTINRTVLIGDEPEIYLLLTLVVPGATTTV